MLSFNSGSWAKYGALAVIPCLLWILSYRLLLHPLRKYPGPLAAKLTGFYSGFNALLMRLHLVTFRNIEKYGEIFHWRENPKLTREGDVVRLGPNRLVFNSIEALQDIYNNEKVAKSHVYRLTGTGGIPSIFSAINKRQHGIKRKLIGKAISEKAMRSFEPTMIEQVNIFLRQLSVSARSKSPVNMTDLCERLSMDIVCLLAFGCPLNMQADPTYRFIIRGIHMGMFQNNCFMQFPLLKTLRLHYIILLVGLRQRRKYINKLQLMIKERLSKDKLAVNDLYSIVADHLDDPEDGITTSELWSEALFFMPAGGDTTSTTLSALFFYLSRHPTIYSKLVTEIRTTFTSSDEIRSGAKLSGCRYLRACIDETLRISPPVSGTLSREPFADQLSDPFVIDGHIIPPGTQVGVCIYALHHNEKYFPDPFAFHPERWLIQDFEILKLMNSAFTAFSIGTRGCAGKAMAYLESSLTVAKTLWHFDFEAAPGKLGRVGGGVSGNTNGRGLPDEFQIYDIFSGAHSGPNLVFSPRENHWTDMETKS